MSKFKGSICGYVYDPAKLGGVAFTDLPCGLDLSGLRGRQPSGTSGNLEWSGT